MPGDCIVAMDPGLSGAVAFYWIADPDRVDVHDMPVVDKQVNAAELVMLLRLRKPKAAVIEQMQPMGKMGAASSMKLGRNFGVLIGVVTALEIPMQLAQPSRWKKAMRLTADKEHSRRIAIERFPRDAASFKRKKDEGRAEAALLALWAATVVATGDAR